MSGAVSSGRHAVLQHPHGRGFPAGRGQDHRTVKRGFAGRRRRFGQPASPGASMHLTYPDRPCISGVAEPEGSAGAPKIDLPAGMTADMLHHAVVIIADWEESSWREDESLSIVELAVSLFQLFEGPGVPVP